MRTVQVLMAVIGLLLGTISVVIADVPSKMNVQGILTDIDGNPKPAGSYIFVFKIFDAETDGDSIWGEQQTVQVKATGLWNAHLGSINPLSKDIFIDPPRWLEVTVDGETLDRVPLQTGPYTFRSASSQKADTAFVAISGSGWVDDGSVVRLETDTDSVGIGTSSPGANLHVEGTIRATDKGSFGPKNHNPGASAFVAGDADTAGGNYSTVSGGLMNVAGATLSAIGGGNANRVSNEYGTIGGGFENEITGFAGTIAGGRKNSVGNTYAMVGGGYHNYARGGYSVVAGGGGSSEADSNSALGSYSVVSGGRSNAADGDYASVGGGYLNTAAGGTCITMGGGYQNNAIGHSSTVGGGRWNDASAEYSTIAGGYDNTADSNYSTVGGGHTNYANALQSTIAGGAFNQVDFDADVGTIGGGDRNRIMDKSGTIGGGDTNTVDGICAVVPGGRQNRALGDNSFAAGSRAVAGYDGAFIWADQQDIDFSCIAINEFAARATGGVRFVTAIDGSGTPTAGVQVAAGDGSWSSISDRNSKENIQPVDGAEVLAKIATLPISTWNYKAQDESIRHIGPMAQDLYAAFGLGEDERHIATIDADGIALAAIQGLCQQNQELKKENDEIKAELAEIRALMQQLLEDRQ